MKFLPLIVLLLAALALAAAPTVEAQKAGNYMGGKKGGKMGRKGRMKGQQKVSPASQETTPDPSVIGALIVRGALAAAERGANYGAFAPGRLVKLAPPNRGVGLIGRLGGGTMAEFVFGRPVRDLGVGAAALENLGAPGLEVGVIAGSRRFHALNPISYVQALVGSEEPHDGTVEVSRTRFDGMTDFTVVAAHHTFICDHPQVIAKTVRFLRSGRFDDEPRDVE